MSERTQKLRKRLAAGELASGIFMCMNSPMVGEIAADSGFDWVLVDAEHQPFNPETLLHILLAFRGSDTVPLMRVPWNDEVMIKQALDMGFEGIVTPQTNSAKEVRRAVSACRYPPMGTRGFGPMRPGGYHRRQEEYVRTADDQIICCVQIEDIRALNEIDEMVRVPGLDWVIVGIYDMSGSMGKLGQVDDPELWDALARIVQAAKKAGVTVGIPCAMGTPEGIRKTIETGSQLVSVGTDVMHLTQSLDRTVHDFREACKKRELK